MTVSQNTLPLLQADVAQFGKHIPSLDYWLQHDRMDAGVKQGAYRDEIGKIDLPVMYISSWLDGTAVGTGLNYLQMVANGRKHQKLVRGPWDHFTNRESIVGLRDFGPEAYIDLKMLTLRWFDRWLKDRPQRHRHGAARQHLPAGRASVGAERPLALPSHDATEMVSARAHRPKRFWYAVASGA